MPREQPRRVWLESICGSITGILAILTLFWPQWIEAVFGIDPDGGNGSAEWLTVGILLIATVLLAVNAHFVWRRTRLSQR